MITSLAPWGMLSVLGCCDNFVTPWGVVLVLGWYTYLTLSHLQTPTQVPVTPRSLPAKRNSSLWIFRVLAVHCLYLSFSICSGCGLTRLWFLLAIEAGKTNVFSRVSESKVQRVWASIDVDEIQFWERFSGADFFSLRVDNSRVGNIVWLTVLILKARKH